MFNILLLIALDDYIKVTAKDNDDVSMTVEDNNDVCATTGTDGDVFKQLLSILLL